MPSDDLMPIAIVGMACRLPGDVSTPNDFWRLMSKGRSCWSKIPEDRFNPEAYNHPNPEKKGATINAQGGYFLSQDIQMFDPAFFDMTKKEAETMDPVQRLLLECTYEALENAGIPKEKISGRNVGVFIGGSQNEHRHGNLRDLDDAPMYDPTGSQGAFLAGRISYFYNLRGPAFTLDTACSSSMYAIHQAVQSIRSGESEQAIVGASHLITQPDIWVSMAKLRLFAESGKTYSFDHRAKSGYARGEGAGVVILKPLHKALEDGDHVRAVIKHTGLSHNGRTVGIVAPSEDEQERLVRNVLSQAKVDPNSVAFFEAHGTGTAKGDPIEATAIHRVFDQSLSSNDPLYIGSVKANIGHLENASGIVSVIKAALMLEKGFIVPNADFERANPAIPLADWNMKIPQRQLLLPRNKSYVCVNNFGFSGSNGHAILEPIPSSNEKFVFGTTNGNEHLRSKRLFVLSANDEEALRQSVEKLGVFLEQHAELYQTTMSQNLAYTLCQRRSHLSWRLAIVSDMCSSLAVALNSADAVPSRAPSQPPKVAFVFTGQGAQWHAMGRELLKSHPVFESAIKKADKYLLELGSDFSLYEELLKSKEDTQVNKAHISQPICSAVQIALVDLLASWGVKPSAVTGHSSGEIGAAYAAGALKWQGAMSAAYYRGQAIVELKKRHPELKGAMMAVGMSAENLKPMFKTLRHPLQAVAACENSPESTTVSGDEEAIDAVAAMATKKGLFNRKLQVDVAYHSPHMRLIADYYYATISSIGLCDTDGSVEFFSSVRAQKIGTDELGPQYWVDNLTNPVRFSSAVQKLCQESSPDIIVEIGPAAALKGPMLQTLKSLDLPASKMPGYMSALVRNRDATVTCMELAGQLWTRGYEGLDWFNINHNRPEIEKPDVITYLYAYPWTRQRCWYESRITRQHRLKAFARHDLLGTLADWSSDLEPTWRNFIRLDELPWLRDSLFQMRIVFPVSAFISMIIEAANQRAVMQSVEAGTFELRDVVVKEHLYLVEGEQVEMLVNFQPWGVTGDEFRIATYEAKRGWVEHCRGVVEVKPAEAGDSRRHSSVMRQTNMNKQPWQKQIPAATHYLNMIAQGAGCPGFMWNMKKMGIDGDTYSANGALLETNSLMPMEYEKPYLVHPAVLEPLLQVSQVECGIDGIGAPQLTSSIRQIRVTLSSDWRRSAGEKFFVQSTKDRKTGTFLAELFAPIESKTSVVSILGLKLSPPKAAAAKPAKPRELCYKMQWVKTAERKANGICQTHLDLHGSCLVLVSDRAPSDPLMAALSRIIQENVGITPRVSKLGEIQDVSGLFIILSELDKSLLASIGKEEFAQVQKLMVRSGGLMWVTRGASKVATNPNANAALGLVRNTRSELVKLASILDLDPNSKLDVSAQAELIEDAFRRSVLANNPEAEAEFAEEDGDLVVPRILVDEETNLNIQRELGSSAPYLQAFRQPGRQLRLAADVDGSLESLHFEDCPSTSPSLGENEVEIEVMASRLGRDDVPCNAAEAGSTKERSCSGVVARIGAGVATISVGDGVCLLAEGSLGSHARAPATSVFRLPQGLSYEDAALVPSAFGTAFYALAEVARAREGEKVLIQAGGDVGLAAIEVARHLGADVFVAAQGPEEREAIINSCAVDPERVLDVRSVYFDREVQAVTKGHGMEVVFTTQASTGGASVSGAKIWSCAAPFGRVVATQGSYNSQEAKGTSPPMAENVGFTTVDMLSLAATRPNHMAAVLAAVGEGFTQGHFTPLRNLQALPVTELPKGLQMVQQGALEPVVVTSLGGEQVMATHDATGPALNRDGTHVIVGGTGGLGRSMAQWMVKNGARHIVLLSRSGGNNAKVKKLVQKLSGQATIVAKACDVAEEQQVRRLISDCAKTLPPICGVVHAAMVLEDGLFEDMTHASWASTVRSKIDGTWNIHNALEAADARLDYFVLFSSASGVLGSRGQAAYAAANTFLDGFAAYRTARGLPGVSLDLTAITGAGYIAENKEREEEILKNFGGETASIDEVLGLLAVAVAGRCPQAQVLTGLKLAPHPQTGALPYYASDPRFAALKAAAEAAAQAAGGGGGGGVRVVSYREAYRAAAKKAASGEGDAAALVEVATEGILEKLSEVLSMARADVDAQRSMASYGLDSLTAIEVRNWITRELGANLQILELLTTANVTVLAELIVCKTEGTGAAKA